MSTEIIGLLGFALLVVLIVMRVPVAFSMFFVGIGGFLLMTNLKSTMSMVSLITWSQFSNYTYTAAIMFIWMGYIASHSGLSKYIFEAADKFIGHISAGLEIVTTVACTAFGAICGSTMATTAAMGTIALPEMDKYKHAPKLSRGCVGVSGILGIMIPPSIPLIVYGITTETSIGKLFLATIPAGILLCVVVCLTSFLWAKLKPEMAPRSEKSSWKDRFNILFRTGTFEVIFIFVFVLCGMFIGWFTPTESGAMSVLAMLLVTIFRKRLTWEKFLLSLKDTTKQSGMIFLVVVAATVFGNFISISRLPVAAVNFTENFSSPFIIMMMLMVLQLILGCLMDGIVVLVLTLPIIYPVATSLGYDPVWLGVVLVLLTGIGMVTPPVGLNAYVVRNIDPLSPKPSLSLIFGGMAPFIFVITALCVLFILFPSLITWIL